MRANLCLHPFAGLILKLSGGELTCRKDDLQSICLKGDKTWIFLR
jgi:hypothetical protein